jgi:hypothetical protein
VILAAQSEGNIPAIKIDIAFRAQRISGLQYILLGMSISLNNIKWFVLKKPE